MKTIIGLERLLDSQLETLSGKRVGLVSHPAAVLPDYVHGLDALRARGVNITALFGAEHGFFGESAAGVQISNQIDQRTGLPVFSLYGDAYLPSAEALSLVDVMLFDMQDVGARFYTYISTLWHVMIASAEHGKRLVVCDRPNPLGGLEVEGPLVAPEYYSFVGITSLPNRYGMTMGELARLFKDLTQADIDLEVIRMEGWTRGMWFDETGQAWVAPSTNMPTLATATVYPGMCLFESTNLSEGRGTTVPFETIGAPWLDAHALAKSLNNLDLPGVRFRPSFFTPASNLFAGEMCQGVQVHVTDRDVFRPVRTAVKVLQACEQANPDKFMFMPPRQAGQPAALEKLSGTDQVRRFISGELSEEDMFEQWSLAEQEFAKMREPYLLY